MKKLFEKNEVTFAIVLIVVYVVGSSVMKRVSEMAGIEYLAEAVFDLAMTAVLSVFIAKNHLSHHLGLCKPTVSAGKMLFYIPLLFIACSSVLIGFAPQYPAAALVSRTVMMLFVGFLEEIIFRGFLFRGMAKDGLKSAIIVSSLTFGIGHIVNLFNGYDLLKNILQVIFAVGVGFLLVMIFVRTGSLIACIVFHSLNNILNGFSSGEILVNAVGKEMADIVFAAVMLVITMAYLLYILKFTPKKTEMK